MAGVVDTSAFITLERRGAFIKGEFPWFQDDTYYISTITISELAVGAHRASSLERRMERERVLARIINDFPALPFGVNEALVHADINAQLMAKGQLIGAYDLVIAASALAHDYFVLTHNLRDFQRVPGLTVKAVDW